MLTLRTSTSAAAALALVLCSTKVGAQGPEQKSKYYFKVASIQSANTKLIPTATELLKAEVASRPELATDIATAESEDGQAALRRQQGVQGYEVSMRIESFTEEIKPPPPGQTEQKMAISVKLTVLGHTIPGKKLMFTGDGDASLIGDFSERLKDKEQEGLRRTALAAAIKQAVSTAIAKLSNATLPSGPPKARHRHRTKTNNTSP